MKLTVGPLPSAVYWRRRAVVLGAMLVVVSVLWLSVSTTSRSAPGTTSSAHRGTGTSASSTILTPTTTGLDSSGAATGAGAPAAGAAQGQAAGTGQAAGAGTGQGQATAGAAGQAPPPGGPAVPPVVTPCADTEIALAPAAEPNPAPRGGTVRLLLKVKNISARTCSRDLGADAQELYIQVGTDKMWSSDACNALHGTSVQNLAPGVEQSFYVNWTGKASNAGCEDAKRAIPPAGKYQLFARLATKISDPLILTLA